MSHFISVCFAARMVKFILTSNLDSIGKSNERPRKFRTKSCFSELYTETTKLYTETRIGYIQANSQHLNYCGSAKKKDT